MDGVTITPDPSGKLLVRLDGVRKSSHGWTARCPAHEDRSASLSIASGDDGRVLLHCFAGCRATDIVAAVGLELSDLFVKRLTEKMSRAERARLQEYARQSGWRAALNVLAFESKIVSIAGHELLVGKLLSSDDCARLERACELIDGAHEVLHAQST